MRAKFLLSLGMAVAVATLSADAQTASQSGAQNQSQSSSSNIRITKGPLVESVSDTTAVVAWSTNVAAGSVVKYGTDPNSLTQTAQAPWGGITHRVAVKNLQPQTVYYFNVESGQAQGTGTSARSNTMRFTTVTAEQAKADAGNAAGQGQFRIVNGPVIESVQDTSFQVAWSTNGRASSTVKYGTDPNNLDQTAQQVYSAGSTHRVRVERLQPNTTYYFRAESANARGTDANAQSDVMRVKTNASGQSASNSQPGNAQPGNAQSASNARIIAGPIVQDLRDTQATLWFKSTGNLQGAQVRYGLGQNNLDQTAQVQVGQDNQATVQLSNLQPNKTYYFEVSGQSGSFQNRGQFQTADANFREGGKVYITDGPVIEFLNQNQAIIAWSTNARSSSVVRYGTDANSLNQTAQAPWGQETHRVTVKNLQPNTTYYFQIESAQAERTGTQARGNTGQFTTIQQGEQAFNNRQQR